MSLPTFYHQDFDTGHHEIGLLDSERQHAQRSRRLQVGDQVCILNGKGLSCVATIRSLSKREFVAAPQEFFYKEKPQNSVSLAIALPKQDRHRFLIESLVQLGVQAIHLLDSERSISFPAEKAQNKLRRYAIEALKQSQNAWLPEMHNPMKLEDFLNNERLSGYSSRLLADQHGKPILETLIPEAIEGRCLALIGPQGGFTREEYDKIVTHEFVPVSAGHHILRVEVAAISVASILSESLRIMG